MTPTAENDAPTSGDIYGWSGDPTMTMEVVSVGRKYAQVRVTQANGASWMKRQPLPFPDSFTRVIPPGK